MLLRSLTVALLVCPLALGAQTGVSKDATTLVIIGNGNPAVCRSGGATPGLGVQTSSMQCPIGGANYSGQAEASLTEGGGHLLRAKASVSIPQGSVLEVAPNTSATPVARANTRFSDVVRVSNSNVARVEFANALTGTLRVNRGDQCNVANPIPGPGGITCTSSNITASPQLDFFTLLDGTNLISQLFLATPEGFSNRGGSRFNGIYNVDQATGVTEVNGTVFTSVPIGQSGVAAFTTAMFAGANYANRSSQVGYVQGEIASDFYSTARLVGVLAYDAAGNDITAQTTFSFDSGIRVAAGAPAVVPEPGTWALMGTGLLGLGGVAARRRRPTV